MKIKSIALLLCVLMLLPMIFACGILQKKPDSGSTTDDITTNETGETNETNSEENITDETTDNNFSVTDEPTTEEETTEEPQGIEWDEESYLDKTAQEFLESIKDGDCEKLAVYMYTNDNIEAYRFIADMTVDSYIIIETKKDGEYSKYFKVKFNISQSNNEYFFVGENYWDLIVTDGPGGGNLFRPSDAENSFESLRELQNDAGYIFCYCFSHNLGIYKTAGDFNTVFETSPSQDIIDLYMQYYGEDAESQWRKDMLHNIIHYCSSTTPDRERIQTFADIEDYMIKTTGITGIDYTNGGNYSSGDNIGLICDAHGGNWLYWLPVSKSIVIADNFEAGISTTFGTVVIDYYADNFYFVVAKTIEYKFRLNDDGTYKMLSTEVLYDSGLNVAGGSI